LTHNQIEMGFFQPASVGVVWLIVGAAGGMGQAGRGVDAVGSAGWRVAGLGVAGTALFGVSAWNAVSLAGHAGAMSGADAALRRGDLPLAVSRLAEAQDAAGLDTTALRWRVRLHAIEPMGPLVAAGRSAEARRRVDEALRWIDSALAGPRKPLTTLRLRAQVLELASQRFGGAGDFAAAEAAYAVLAERSPYNVADAWVRAELARRAGDDAAARQRYERVLELREQKYLDAADPLAPEQLERARVFLSGSG
ncbi:MAG: hypothetical protein AAFX76_09720, partial [Planctomycetota bacterium]